jgi:prevent-host-death family protein
MKFITVRELRAKAAEVWRELAGEKDVVVTSNGKPVALLSAASEETLEESLLLLRRARAQAALRALQSRAAKAGKRNTPLAAINAEIAAVRRRRAKAAA